MVKVKEDPGMAEQPTPSPSSYSSPPKRKPPPRSYLHPPQPHTHHHHHIPTQFSPHYHYCTYLPDGSEVLECADGPTAPPAKFYFGPGFEPQQPSGAGSIHRPGGQAQSSQYVVFFHVNPGVTISFQMGDSVEILRGPVTVPMVSTNSSPPIAMPVQVPPGHMVQQIVDENGTLRHVILSPQHPPDIVSLASHTSQPYGTCPGNATTQSQQQYFPGVSSPYPPPPPPHFHSSIQPTGGGHPMIPSPTHMQHSSPPPQPPQPVNQTYYKDERTQRQHIKLKKKLQEKHRTDGSVLPRRDNLVGELQTTNNSDAGKVATVNNENGEEISGISDEESLQLIVDILSSVQSPMVSELTSRSALLQWGPPVRLPETASKECPVDIIQESDLRYEVLLSDKSKEMKFKSIYSGTSLSCRIQDLKPGQDYAVCLQVHLDDLQGFATDPFKFSTPACEPDQPQPPKLIHRSKNSLQLRWNSVNDNGSQVTCYILEYDNGKGAEFVEFYKGRGKTHTLQKLQPATAYTFRLAVVNDVGKSLYSDSITYATFDNPPAQPNPPNLVEAGVQSLHLQWQRRPKDDEFILQINDIETKYGFLNVFHGKDNAYLCKELRRFTDYVFRLRTKNEDGASPWSEEVTYRTLPDRPSRPSKPIVKGRIHAHYFKIKWDPPNDTGGVQISKYILEVNSGSGYEIIYSGSETEALCDKLTPGTTYQLRVNCITDGGGASNYSDPCTVTTDAISPGQCLNVRLHGKPKATSATVRWSPPDYNGGAPVLDYEIEVVPAAADDVDSSSQRMQHKCKETEFSLHNLCPGTPYTVNVRAVNRIGPGIWSEPLKLTSGAAPPTPPPMPSSLCKSYNHVYVEWQEPKNHGAPITEYRLEMGYGKDIKFSLVYHGIQMSHDIKGLQPAQTYYFRVQAGNSAGYSLFSPVAMVMTPAAPPASITSIKNEVTPTSIRLHWHPPADNGSPITHYNIEIGDRTLCTEEPVNEYLIENLQPNTIYKVKIQAVNGVAPGAFSSSTKICTSKLPPSAPVLECIGTGHNYLKLKWGDGKNTEYIQYCVEMENPLTKEIQSVYRGTALTCKVNKLLETTTYKFRINASNDTGIGDFSDFVEFATSIAPPGAIKVTKIVEVDQHSCTLEWLPAKNYFSDPVMYEVQLSRSKQQTFAHACKTSETKCTLENLIAGCEHNVRIIPYRITAAGEQLPGPSSSTVRFTTQSEEPEAIILPTTNVAHKSNNLYFSLGQLSTLPSKYSSYMYVIAVMILGIVISLGIACFL